MTKRKLINKLECKKKHLYRWIRNTFHTSWPCYIHKDSRGNWWKENGYDLRGELGKRISGLQIRGYNFRVTSVKINEPNH